MMPPEDLAAVIRSTLISELPTVEHHELVDRLAVALTRAILDRDKRLADAYRPTYDRAALVEALTVEAQQPLPRRPPVPVSRPNLDTPDVVAARLRMLAEMPDVEITGHRDGETFVRPTRHEHGGGPDSPCPHPACATDRDRLKAKLARARDAFFNAVPGPDTVLPPGDPT